MSVMLAAALAGGGIDAGVLAETAGETPLSEFSTGMELSNHGSDEKSQRNQKSEPLNNSSTVENLNDRVADIISAPTTNMLSNFEMETNETVEPKPEMTSNDTAEIKDSTDETEALQEAATERYAVSEESEDSTVPVSSGTILEILDSDTLSSLDPVVIVQNTSENNDSLLMRILQLQSVTARVRTSEGEETTICLFVDWNVGRLDLPQIDVSVAGEYEEIGTIVFPDGYTCADHVLRQLRLPVQVVIPESPIILTAVDTWTAVSEAYVISVGSDLSDFTAENLPQLWNCYDSSDTLYQASICWDTSGIDLSTPGLYQLTGTLSAPEYTVFAETLAIPKLCVPISVQDPLKPDINCIFPARGTLYVPLIGLPGDPAQVQVWLRRQGDDWLEITESGDCQILSNVIYLSDSLFTLQETYELQITYEGGKTGILTFLFDETMEHFQYSGGDRDGGDSGTGKDNDRVRPAPELPETEQTKPEQSETSQPETNQTETETPGSSSGPSSLSAANQTEVNSKSSQTSIQTEPDSGTGSSDSPGKADTSDRKSQQKSGSVNSDQTLTEHFTSDYDRISGTRLLLTLETSGCAQFSKHGITITVSKAALDALSIACEDFFRITILQPSDDTFSFFFEKNETAVPTLPGVRIMLPWSGDADCGLILLDEQRHIVAYGSCDSDSHIASFVTDQTGTFLIIPDDGTVATLATLIDACRNSFLQQMSRYSFWLLCF